MASGSCRKFSKPGIAAMRDRIGFRSTPKFAGVNTPTTPGMAAAAGNFDGTNSAVRPRASKYRRVQHAFQMDVVDIPANAGQ